MIQRSDVLRLPAPLPLRGGGLLVDTEIAYEAWGVAAPDKALVVLHDFCDSHRALGHGPNEGWGKPLIGPGLPFDPARHWVVSLCLLGHPYGSTNALMLPQTSVDQEPVSFSLEDMARAAASAMRLLGIRRPRAVAGIGLGGMVALKMAALFPDLVAGALTFGTSSGLPRGVRVQLGTSWHQYRSGSLRSARADYLRRHFDHHWLVRRLGDSAAARAFISHQADRFFDHFDERAYVSLAATYADADLGDVLEQITCRALLIGAAPDELAPSSRVRETYHHIAARGAQAHFQEIDSPGGHATLLEQTANLNGPIIAFLESLR